METLKSISNCFEHYYNTALDTIHNTALNTMSNQRLEQKYTKRSLTLAGVILGIGLGVFSGVAQASYFKTNYTLPITIWVIRQTVFFTSILPYNLEGVKIFSPEGLNIVPKMISAYNQRIPLVLLVDAVSILTFKYFNQISTHAAIGFATCSICHNLSNYVLNFTISKLKEITAPK